MRCVLRGKSSLSYCATRLTQMTIRLLRLFKVLVDSAQDGIFSTVYVPPPLHTDILRQHPLFQVWNSSGVKTLGTNHQYVEVRTSLASDTRSCGISPCSSLSLPVQLKALAVVSHLHLSVHLLHSSLLLLPWLF